MKNVPNIISNLLPAVMMTILTIITAWAIICLLFFRKKGKTNNTVKKNQKENKGYSRCTLNEIMGYDFIQIKEIEKKEEKNKTKDKTEETKPVMNFADSRSTGTRELMNTESTDEVFEDMAEEEIYNLNDYDIAEKLNKDEDEEDDKPDEDELIGMEIKDEYNDEMLMDIESQNDWPKSSIPDEQKNEFANWIYSGIKGDDNDIQPEQSNLAMTSPEEEQLFYKEREQISNILQQLQSMHDNNYMTPEQEEAFNNISKIGSTSSSY